MLLVAFLIIYNIRMQDTTEVPKIHWLSGFIWLAILAPLFFIVYGWANTYSAGLPVDGVKEFVYDWERHIPFIPWTILPYWSIDFLYGISLFLPLTKFAQRQHALRLLVATPIAAAFFYFYPLTFSGGRPDAEGLWKTLFDALLGFDKPFNQSPSLHIILLVIIWQIYLPQFKQVGKLLWNVWCFLIGISVLTTFQHHFIDIPAGFLVGVVICFIFPLVKEHQWKWNQVKITRLARYYLIPAIILLICGMYAPFWPALVLLWIGFSMLVIGLGYMNFGPIVFQKHDNGTFSFAAKTIHLPYRSISKVVRYFFFSSYKEPQKITDNLYLGAYAMDHLTPCDAIFDVCSEYERANYKMEYYVNYPLIDLEVPSIGELRLGVEKLDALLQNNRVVFIHCALGMSRSAILVMGWMLYSKKVRSVEAAIQYFRDHNFKSNVSDKHITMLHIYSKQLAQ
jgi:membrane-associated phospholipid phosphatase